MMGFPGSTNGPRQQLAIQFYWASGWASFIAVACYKASPDVLLHMNLAASRVLVVDEDPDAFPSSVCYASQDSRHLWWSVDPLVLSLGHARRRGKVAQYTRKTIEDARVCQGGNHIQLISRAEYLSGERRRRILTTLGLCSFLASSVESADNPSRSLEYLRHGVRRACEVVASSGTCVQVGGSSLMVFQNLRTCGLHSFSRTGQGHTNLHGRIRALWDEMRASGALDGPYDDEAHSIVDVCTFAFVGATMAQTTSPQSFWCSEQLARHHP